MSSFRKSIGIFLTAYWLSACSAFDQTPVRYEHHVNGIPVGPAEMAYCPFQPSRSDFAGATVTISGQAGFVYRMNGPEQNGALSAQPKPIRHAEVRVEDLAGNTMQCAETDEQGHFSFLMPQGGEYVVVVSSRAANHSLQASVLDRPETNRVYELRQRFQTTRSASLPQLIAQANQKLDPQLRAGAFNILDDLYQANQWLREQTAHCDDSSSPHFVAANCVPFEVAPKIKAYFSAGFNPGSYFVDGSGRSPAISFYLPGMRILMILGGMNGDVDHSDNDQFDDSVIIHEYGHFIEDVYGQTNSPGGSHDGNSIVDPRLAWGEGWANFFQAAVTGFPYYRDTHGTAEGSFGVYFFEDLSSPFPWQSRGQVTDIPLRPGEGVYREFSVARTLWAAIAPHVVSHTGSQEPSVNGGIGAPFAELWYLFADAAQGFRASSFHFRNMNLWLENQAKLAQTHAQLGDLRGLRGDEHQEPGASHYANSTAIGGCDHTAIVTGFKSAFDDGSFATSDLSTNNHFYEIHHPGGPLTVELSWNSQSESTDLDLYLYTENYVYGDRSTMVGWSNAQGACAANCSKRLSLANLSAGVYMLNLMVFTAQSAGSASTYDLRINGGLLCPGQ